MKKIFITIIVLIAFSTIVSAAMEPSKPFCEHQGYTFDEGNSTPNTMYCIIDNDNKYLSLDFFNGDCGQEYLKEFPCRQEGEHVWSQFEECCEGLIPTHLKYKGYFGKTMIGQSMCEPIPNFFNRFLRYSLIFWLSILIVISFIINWIIRRRKTTK